MTLGKVKCYNFAMKNLEIYNIILKHIPIYAPTTDAEEVEVDQLYEMCVDAQDLLELTPKKKKKMSFTP